MLPLWGMLCLFSTTPCLKKVTGFFGEQAKPSFTIEPTPVVKFKYSHEQFPHTVQDPISASTGRLVDMQYVPNNPNTVVLLSESHLSLFDISTQTFIWHRLSPTAIGIGQSIWNGGVRQGEFGKTALSPDGKMIAVISFHSEVALVSRETGEVLRKTKNFSDLKKADHDIGFTLKFSPDSQFVIAGNSVPGIAIVYESQSLKKVIELHGPTTEFADVGFSKNGKLVYGASENHIIFWEVSTGKIVKNLPIKSSGFFEFSDDMRFAMISQGNDFVMVDVDTGIEIQKFTGSPFEVSNFSFSSDGTTIVSLCTSNDGKHAINVWNIASGRMVEQVMIQNIRNELARVVQLESSTNTIGIMLGEHMHFYKIKKHTR